MLIFPPSLEIMAKIRDHPANYLRCFFFLAKRQVGLDITLDAPALNARSIGAPWSNFQLLWFRIYYDADVQIADFKYTFSTTIIITFLDCDQMFISWGFFANVGGRYFQMRRRLLLMSLGGERSFLTLKKTFKSCEPKLQKK